MKYNGIVKKRPLWLKLTIIIAAFVLLGVEILRGEYIYIPLGFLVVLAAFFQKSQIISKEGVDIRYYLLGMVVHNYWKWDEVTTLHADYHRAKPNVMLHIGKDIVTRSFIFTKNDCDEILLLAKEMNPKIYIADIK